MRYPVSIRPFPLAPVAPWRDGEPVERLRAAIDRLPFGVDLFGGPFVVGGALTRALLGADPTASDLDVFCLSREQYDKTIAALDGAAFERAFRHDADFDSDAMRETWHSGTLRVDVADLAFDSLSAPKPREVIGEGRIPGESIEATPDGTEYALVVDDEDLDSGA